jgi:hypothetical protein
MVTNVAFGSLYEIDGSWISEGREVPFEAGSRSSTASPHISPPRYYGRRYAAICDVFSLRGARRTGKYDSAPLRSKTPHLTTSLRPRDATW